MGLFGKSDKSGSPGKPGKGYGKGSAATNEKKWTARTEAQKARSERALKKWK